jgi:peptide/nickel transport system substrate-binding protein
MAAGARMKPLARSTSALFITPLLAVLAACRGGPPAAPQSTPTSVPDSGRPFIVATQGDVTTFNECQSAGETTEGDIISLLFPALANEQPDYRLHPPTFAPRLASSWEFSPDRHTLTFHLRPDARWSDGTPITSADVRFTFQAERDEAAGCPNREIKDFIRDVEAVDPQTVRFHFSRVYPYQLMDANDGHIFPKHAWDKVPFGKWPTTDFAPLLVTGGPFRLAAHNPQQTIVLARDARWWGAPRPNLGRLVFRILPDGASQVAQLLAGDVDLVQQVPPQEADLVAASPNVRVVEFPSRLLGLVAWNNRRRLLADRQVRRALTLAINRKAIVDTAYHGHAKVANGPVLSTMWAYDRNLPDLGYDPKLAGELLDQAGWRRPGGRGIRQHGGRRFVFDLLYPAGNTIREQMALLMQADLARVGIEVHPRQVEFTSLIARTDGGEFDAVMWVWEEPTKVDLTEVWSTRTDDRGSSNFIGYSNPEVDRLIAAARAVSDYTKAKSILDRIQELIVADQPVTFLYEANRLVGVNRELEGAEINSAGVFFNVEDWRWGS